MRMLKTALATFTAFLMMGCLSAAAAPITGVTIHNTPACAVSDLSPTSMKLITLWWSLNQKRIAGTLTDDDYEAGAILEMSGQCAGMRGGVPVTIVLSDGTMYLGRWPDGALFGFTDGTVLLDEDLPIIR